MAPTKQSKPGLIERLFPIPSEDDVRIKDPEMVIVKDGKVQVVGRSNKGVCYTLCDASTGKVIEKTEIRFKSPMKGKEAREMLKYAAKRQDCGCRFKATQMCDIYNHCIPDEVVDSEISGHFYESPGVSVSFELLKDSSGEYSHFSAMRFFTPPGYELDEIPKDEIELMGDIRQHVEKYFSKRPGMEK